MTAISHRHARRGPPHYPLPLIPPEPEPSICLPVIYVPFFSWSYLSNSQFLNLRDFVSHGGIWKTRVTHSERPNDLVLTSSLSPLGLLVSDLKARSTVYERARQAHALLPALIIPSSLSHLHHYLSGLYRYPYLSLPVSLTPHCSISAIHCYPVLFSARNLIRGLTLWQLDPWLWPNEIISRLCAAEYVFYDSRPPYL